MELRHLRYFVAVAETLSFSLAAKNLHLSGPALSKQIKDLEVEMGVRLLDRDTTQVNLTNAGGVFLIEARKLLTHAGQAVAMAKEAAAGQRGRLTIGNIGLLLANFLAASLSNFCTRFPEVDVDLIDVDLFEQTEALKAHRIQVGFILAGERTSVPPHFKQASVLHSPLGVVSASSHRFAQQTRVSLADAAKEKLLAIRGRRGSFHADFVRSVFTNHGFKPGPITLVNGLESFMAMIAARQGISILAIRGSLGRANDLALRPIKETGDDLGIELYAVWRDTPKNSPAANFVDELKRLTQAQKKVPTKKKTE